MLFFIHIPKTGGTSIYNALRSMIPDRLAWYTGAISNVQSFLSTPENRRSVSVYAGHFTYFHIKEFLTLEDKIFSVIRDPIERAFSHYNHILVRDKNHPLHHEIRDRSIIEASKASPRFASEISNHMCLYLSGTRNCEETKSIVLAKRIKIYSMGHLNLMVKHLGEECGVTLPREVSFDNAADNDYMAQVTPEEIDFVRELNKEDSNLFSFFTAGEALSS